MPSEDHIGKDNMESQTGEGIIRQVSMCLREMLFGIET
jgi:hypothetical protein